MLSQTLMSMLLPKIRTAISAFPADEITEIRLQSGRAVTVSLQRQNRKTDCMLTEGDMAELTDRFCEGSLHAYAETMANGYIPLRDGTRIGVCGSLDGGYVHHITSFIIRVPHQRQGIGLPLAKRLYDERGGCLIYSPPGEGKTTLLRDTAAILSSPPYLLRLSLIDSRGELWQDALFSSSIADCYRFYPKDKAIEIATRTASPHFIVCDEIGTEDIDSILKAENAGVPLIATAHASSVEGLLRRPGFDALHRAKVFKRYVGLMRHGFKLSFRNTEWEDVAASSAKSLIP